MHGLLTTTKRMQCFAIRVVAVGVGEIPVRLESGESIIHNVILPMTLAKDSSKVTYSNALPLDFCICP